ncbi:peptidoglycan D,D-transpeptidase FtsI family protein [Nigerium massiliense]|uniref:peptidoglycan D,D-transpeptidase FtsI family protein n=1 Tax=Nigerium massiliense TaxID=1522317 RepID=UPI0005914D98|nr:penicillin-binding transpeptidase domain-containing protein [Nigerium massiliense]
MNGPIRKVSVVVMIMFLALMLNSSYAYVFRTDALTNDPNNRRVRDAQFGTDRGDILVGNTPVVTSKPSNDRYEYQRVYSQAPLYAPVTGYYSFLYGSAGLEQSQNQALSGAGDAQFLQRMVDLATGKKPTGASIQTTLDARAQRAAYRALNGRPGAVVALDYSTGEVRAMVSTPSYDPNSLATHDLDAAQKNWTSLNKDSDQPMLNRAAKNVYPPGSTFKVVTSAAALESGMNENTSIPAPASYKLPNSTAVIKNAGSCGGAQISLKQALQVSCNSAFAGLGVRLGDGAIRKQAEAFGFGKTQLSDIGAVPSRFPEKPDAAQTAMSAIGQFEVAATPLQMAMVAAGVANDGVVMDPYIVSQVRGADLSVLSTRSPRQLSRAMSAQNARQLKDMMINVVQNGTGRRAQVSGVTVGGKTGTAKSDGRRPPYAWFIAFSDNPQVAVAVFVQDSGATTAETSGGRFAGPIAAAVIEALR